MDDDTGENGAPALLFTCRAVLYYFLIRRGPSVFFHPSHRSLRACGKSIFTFYGIEHCVVCIYFVSRLLWRVCVYVAGVISFLKSSSTS